ncbi:MAG: hypothetical protein LBB17_01395 [Puniceicoccales bacterium]|jgi:hypothetical protein|nr:hypothetical protein [Puniceicoccales bacterium]
MSINRELIFIDFWKIFFILAQMVASVKNKTDQVIMEDVFSPVIQFSVLLGGKNISFNSMLKALSVEDVSILAISFLENFETATIRFVVNYPDIVRKFCSKNAISYHETKVLGIEVDSIDRVVQVVNIIFSAEVKIHYMYSLLVRPGGKIGIILQTENNEFATNILHQTGIRTISQSDIGR